MPADTDPATAPVPRAGRYLIPGQTPYRAQIIAAGALIVLLGHLFFAQLTLILAVVLYSVARLSRWRPQWLAVPAVAGLIWVLAIGPASAAAGFTQGPAQIAAYLGSIPGHPGELAHLGVAFTGMGRWLPRQFPLALIAAAAEAALAAWLGWLHADEWQVPGHRPGLLILARRACLTRFIRAGSVVSRDGACLGIDSDTGRRSAVSWAEALGGVLCVGSAGSGASTTSFQLAHAAVRLRKPVIAVDLTGSRALAGSFTAACAASGTPLHVFPPAGACYYDPLRGGDPARRTSLVMGMTDWDGTADSRRRTCAAYLTDLFAVLDAAPGDPRVPVLDEVVHLLRPDALQARAGCIPGYHQRRQALAERVRVSVGLVRADPHAVAALTEQLDELRSSTLGGWLAPARGSRVHLHRVIRERAAVLFSLDQSVYGRAAVTLAGLIARDVLALRADLERIGVSGDGLAWFDECGALSPGTAAELAAHGRSGVAALLTSTAPGQVRALADQVGVLVLHRLADPALAERYAGLTGEKYVPARAGLGAGQSVTMPFDAAWRGSGNGAAGNGVRGAARAAAARPGMPPSPDPGAAAAGYGAPVTAAQLASPEMPSGLGQLGPFGLVRSPAVSAWSLSQLATGEHVLVAKAPDRRLVAAGRTVPSRISRPAAALPGVRGRTAQGPAAQAGSSLRQRSEAILPGELGRPESFPQASARLESPAAVRQPGSVTGGPAPPLRGRNGVARTLRKGRLG